MDSIQHPSDMRDFCSPRQWENKGIRKKGKKNTEGKTLIENISKIYMPENRD